MANTTYKELADAFFKKIKDYDFVYLTEEQAYEVAMDYIPAAIVQFTSCKQDLTDCDDKLECFNFELTRVNFQIMVNYMVLEWLSSNYLCTWDSLKSSMTSSDFKKIDTKDMLTKVMELYQMLIKENKSLGIHYSYRDSDIFALCENRAKNRRY